MQNAITITSGMPPAADTRYHTRGDYDENIRVVRHFIYYDDYAYGYM